MNKIVKTAMACAGVLASFIGCQSIKPIFSNKSANGTKMLGAVSTFFYDVPDGVVGPHIEAERTDKAGAVCETFSFYYADTLNKTNWTVKAVTHGSDNYVDPEDIEFFEKVQNNPGDSTNYTTIYHKNVMAHMMCYNDTLTRKTSADRIIMVNEQFYTNLTGKAGQVLNELYNGNVRRRLAKNF